MNMSKRVIKSKKYVGTICEFKSHFAVVVAKIRIKRGISIKIIFVSIFLFLLTIYYICGIINLPFKKNIR